MKYTIRPGYETTIEDMAIRLCDIITGRAFGPQPVQDDDGVPDPKKWDVTGLNNHWLCPNFDEPNVFELSCRSPLKPELVALLSIEFGLVCDDLTFVVLLFSPDGLEALKKLVGTKDNAVVVRKALRLYDHGFECERRGGQVILREKDGSEAVLDVTEG